MKNINTFNLISFVLIFLIVGSITAQVGVYPYPNAGNADVDGLITGDTPDWNLAINSLDWFAPMYEGWNSGPNDKPILTNLYLRYDCETSTMYALVYQATWDGNLIPVIVSNNDAWIAIDGESNKVVLGSSGDDGLAPDFRWIDIGYDGDQNHARGYEASFPLSNTPNSSYQIIAHVNAEREGEQTSGTDDKLIDLNVDCGVLPVELTSFSVKINNNIAQLSWETATEVNNYGFEIERAFEASSNKWTKIGFVEGHGNSNSPKYYSFTDKGFTNSGNYSYRLKQIDIDGTYEYSDVVNITLSAPAEYKLSQNYPNPFNPSTTISYSIPEKSDVSIIVYNLFGEEVERLVNDNKEAGSYSVIFNASELASGLYFYTIETNKFVETKKLLLLK